MAFTDETHVRNHSGLTDSTAVPVDLVTQSIDDSQGAILADLDPGYMSSTDPLLELAATELATAYLFRTLAGQAAGLGRELRTMHLRTGEVAKAPVLERLADEEERRARSHLVPFLKRPPEPFGFSLAEPAKPAE
jgi:hypothetical protein